MASKRYWQQNSHTWQDLRPPLTVGLPVTSERYGAVPRLFHNATVSQRDHFLLLHMYMYLLFETSQADYQVGEGVFFKLNLVGGTQLQCIYYLCCILISRLPRVFRRFKRRSCSYCEQKYYISECCSISVNGMYNFLVFLPDVCVTPIKMSE